MIDKCDYTLLNERQHLSYPQPPPPAKILLKIRAHSQYTTKARYTNTNEIINIAKRSTSCRN